MDVAGASRLGRLGAWLALAFSLVAPVTFVALRAGTPSDAAKIAFYGSAWSPSGVAVGEGGAGEDLRERDIVASVAGRSLEAWLGSVLDPALPRPDPEGPIVYEVLRDGARVSADVRWTQPPVGASLLDAWGFVIFSIAFAGVAAFVFAKRPEEPAALSLVLMACGAAGSTLPWLFGITVSDIVQGTPFLLHSLLTGALYMILWPAGVHMALVFPSPHPVTLRHAWLVPATYGLGLGGYAASLVVARAIAPTTLEWIGMWPNIQLAVVIPLLALMLVIIALRYLGDLDATARARMRWATFGALASGIITLAAFWVPQLFLERPLLDFSWLGVLSLPFPLGLAAGILRHRLFDIDVVINRTLVYGGLTLGVVTMYAGIVTALGVVISADAGYGASLFATGVAALAALPLRDVLQRAVNRVMYGHRDEPWRAMRRLGQGLEWAADPDRAFPTIVEIVADSLRLPYVALSLASDAGSETIVASCGEERGPRLTLPLTHGAERVGSLVLGVRAGERGFRESELRLLEDLARQAGTAITAIRLRADLAQSREHLVLAREEERRRLRRDLHDGLGPALAAIGMRAEAASERFASDPGAATRLLDELSHDVQTALADIRRLVEGLRPAALDELGLVAAIEEQASRLRAGTADRGSAIDIAIDAKPLPLPELPAAVEVAAYRIAVEALTNAVRHSGATRCSVRLAARDALSVEIVDNGSGLPARVVPGVGLESIRVRADELGGTLWLETLEGGGTRVVARLPLDGHAA